MNRKSIKSVLAGFIGASVILFGHELAKPKSPQKIADEVKSAMVTVSVGDASGSGWFINTRGDILTADHTVSSTNQEITVQLPGEKKPRVAKVVSEYSDIDTAILHVDGVSNHEFLKWGSSAKLVDCDTVFQAGSPFDLGPVVAQGIVSAKVQKYQGNDYVVSDVATNPGESGGPLVNENGEAVGMAHGGVSRSGFNIGINLAVPSDEILKRLPQELKPTMSETILQTVKSVYKHGF